MKTSVSPARLSGANKSVNVGLRKSRSTIATRCPPIASRTPSEPTTGLPSPATADVKPKTRGRCGPPAVCKAKRTEISSETKRELGAVLILVQTGRRGSNLYRSKNSVGRAEPLAAASKSPRSVSGQCISSA